MRDEFAIYSFLNRLASSLDWMAHLFLAFMFIVAIWRPQRIFNQGAFRMAMILFALSLTIPSVVTGIWNLISLTDDDEAASSTSGIGRTSPTAGEERAQRQRRMTYTTSLSHDSARVLLGIAVACGVLSLIEPEYLRRRRERAAELANATPLPKQQPPAASNLPSIPLDEA